MDTKLPETWGDIPDQKVSFGDRLSGLCAMELAAAHGDPERIGEIIERLASSLAFTIAIAAHGDPDAMSEMLQGAESYLYEAASSHQKAGAFLRVGHRK